MVTIAKHARRTSVLAVCGLLWLGAQAVARGAELSPVESQKIAFLINSIETLTDATFLRNGKSYDAKTAADHLRTKLKYAGSRVKSADDFIRYCATGSSISGRPYQIRFADGRIVDSEAFLRKQLDRFTAQ